jgi:nitroreductase
METSLQTNDFFTVVRERHAVKHYDPAHKLSEKEILELLEIAGTAPSAWNLQHWKFMAITDQAAKEKLLPIAYGQKQIVDSSVVVAVLGDLQANLNAEDVYAPAVKQGLLTEEIKQNLIGQINYTYANVPKAPRDEAIRNASLAAMQLMLAARAKGLDTCPIGGFDSAKFVETFNVPSRYIPVMLITVGKAASPARPSSRFPVERTVVWNSF